MALSPQRGTTLLASQSSHLIATSLARMPIILSLVFFALLLSAAIVDFRTLRIPDALNVVIALCGLGATALLGRSIFDALLGMAFGYALIFAANAAYRALRGRDGIGMGDAKLLGASGAWLGWTAIPFVILIASTVAIVWVLVLQILGRQLKASSALPFGPALCVGIAISWLALTFAHPPPL